MGIGWRYHPRRESCCEIYVRLAPNGVSLGDWKVGCIYQCGVNLLDTFNGGGLFCNFFFFGFTLIDF